MSGPLWTPSPVAVAADHPSTPFAVAVVTQRPLRTYFADAGDGDGPGALQFWPRYVTAPERFVGELLKDLSTYVKFNILY